MNKALIEEWEKRLAAVNVFQEFDDIIERLKTEYLREDLKPWQIGLSGGKDSSLLLTLVWKMLLQLTKEERQRYVHVVMADTMVETPLMENYQIKVLKQVEKSAYEQGLSDVLRTHMVKPPMKSRFHYKLIGRGTPVPSSTSNRFCTSHLKINPMRKKMEELLKESLENQDPLKPQDPYLMINLLGVRMDESKARANSINNFSTDDLYAKHATDNRILVMHPIRNVTLDELWAYLESEGTLPYGITVAEMKEQYGTTGMECGIKDGSEGEGQSCGKAGSRSGCWTCAVVSEDVMLNNLISEGRSEYRYLLEWKEYMIAIRNDARFRLPTQRQKMNQHARVARESTFSLFDEMDLKNKYEHLYDSFGRAQYTWVPGAMTIEARKRMLEYLLWIEEMTGMKLIEDDELQAIYNTWKEDGYDIGPADIKPVRHVHREKLILKKDGSINDYMTTVTSFPIFYVNIQTKMNISEMVTYIHDKSRETGMHYPYLQQALDYEEHSLVYNEYIFIVCTSHATTQEEAEQLIYSWLDWTNSYPYSLNEQPHEGWCEAEEGIHIPTQKRDQEALSDFVKAFHMLERIDEKKLSTMELWELEDVAENINLFDVIRRNIAINNSIRFSSKNTLVEEESERNGTQLTLIL
ncbi:phosphoadenosine phosphosulfate reductase family protein [Pontibacillus halophilus]|uniref:phosphoadenosine phosphosulfate reductase domain-containing protein n=1 Tax=Pontibacillus halophilus TaxID=516704 RepID=UPI00041A531F|nr:phosphoadenosine phosphosulfate reductase family protein [Pontibacillus halophilus]